HPRQPVGSFLNFPLSYLGGLLIAHVHLMHSVSPIPSHVVSLHFPFLLLRFVLPIPIALNGMFALYRSSIRGQLSIEPLAPFSHRPGQSLPDPPGDRIKVVLMPASSLNRCHIKMSSSMTMCNQGNIRIKVRAIFAKIPSPSPSPASGRGNKIRREKCRITKQWRFGVSIDLTRIGRAS